MGILHGSPEKAAAKAAAKARAEAARERMKLVRQTADRLYKGHRDGLIGRQWWAEARKRTEALLSGDPEELPAVLMRAYESDKPDQATAMAQVEANVLAELGYRPTGQAWVGAAPATLLLGGLGLLAGKTLSVTYERTTAQLGAINRS